MKGELEDVEGSGGGRVGAQGVGGGVGGVGLGPGEARRVLGSVHHAGQQRVLGPLHGGELLDALQLHHPPRVLSVVRQRRHRRPRLCLVVRPVVPMMVTAPGGGARLFSRRNCGRFTAHFLIKENNNSS